MRKDSRGKTCVISPSGLGQPAHRQPRPPIPQANQWHARPAASTISTRGMLKQVPNLLTASRLALAGVFFGILSRYQYAIKPEALLHAAFIVYLIALITDFFDGYLARRWQAASAFGRITDPFVDKVLVLGSFIFFAGKNFVIPESDPSMIPDNVKTITGIAPWMVVLILARELLVTTFRGVAESSGQDFGAAFTGKLKMTLQSITILVILTYVNFRGYLQNHGWGYPAQVTRDVFIWATIVVTIYSGLAYARRAGALFTNKIGPDQYQ
jgi:CDP-diacylglycerol--glycerol-3-phosphate 3-phosphatidyltransferase